MVKLCHSGLNQIIRDIMSLEYSLIIEDHIDASEINKLLIVAPGFKEEKGEIKAEDLLIYITKPYGLSFEVIRDDFGFSPAVDISFRLNKFAEPDVLYKRFMQAVWLVLKTTEGDAVILFNGENIILYRKKGKLYLNDIDNFWYEGTLPTDQQYELKAMKNI
jgi:hypothetical protein